MVMIWSAKCSRSKRPDKVTSSTKRVKVKPFALAVRLFGNMTAGHFVILSLFGIIFLFGNLPYGANWGIALTTAALVTAIMMLELFVAFLQAYVFALLTAVFIGLMQHEH